jgi:hypothetical protein
MREPGDLQELGEAGRASWSARIAGYVGRALKWYGAVPHLRGEPDSQMAEVTGVDWTGYPLRVAECLSSREQALRLLDWTGSRIGGPRSLQEEYLEWRVVRDEATEAIRRVEFTTELADYWSELAAYAPERVRQLVAAFSGQASVPAKEIYGLLDPFANGVTPEQRRDAFKEQMLHRTRHNQYNNGEKAICFMAQASNTLLALVAIAVAGAVRRVTRDRSSKQWRSMTANEAIPQMSNAAVAGRGSDPVLVERLGRLAFEDRPIAFDDPLGVYIQGVEHTRLRDPDGAPVPSAWFTFSRGVGPAEARDARSRYQRLCFEVPTEAGYAISDLQDVATEKPIDSASQLADLVQLAVFLRTGAPGTVKDKGPRSRPQGELPPADDCEKVHAEHRAFLAATETS